MGATEGDIERSAMALAAREDLAAVLLFGSRARGLERPESDVDLALLAERSLDPLSLFDWASALERQLGSPVDLVDLRQVSPVLARQVLRHGRCLALGDRRALERFIVRTVTDYEDLKLSRAPAERALLRGRHG